MHTNFPFTFGPLAIDAFAVVSIYHAIDMSPQSKTYYYVPPPRVLPISVQAPRVILPKHLLNTTQHDATVEGELFDPVTGQPETIDTLLAGKDKTIWMISLTNEIGRCSTRLRKLRKPHEQISGNNMVFFIKAYQVPPGDKVAYCKFVCTMWPNKLLQSQDDCRCPISLYCQHSMKFPTSRPY